MPEYLCSESGVPSSLRSSIVVDKMRKLCALGGGTLSRDQKGKGDGNMLTENVWIALQVFTQNLFYLSPCPL